MDACNIAFLSPRARTRLRPSMQTFQGTFSLCLGDKLPYTGVDSEAKLAIPVQFKEEI